eukprot:305589-Lingulodinium_polyedra.AAC.1
MAPAPGELNPMVAYTLRRKPHQWAESPSEPDWATLADPTRSTEAPRWHGTNSAKNAARSTTRM